MSYGKKKNMMGFKVYKSQKFTLNCMARTHGSGDKAFGGKVLQHEITWTLQVQSLQLVRLTRNTYYNLTLVPSHG